ncbi:hypothetical protein [Pseudomonas sp. WS 5051]|uniref:hypothetical protein n=1 Tax=Pseudomonas sp. WS 5051 TaxID=2717482 RepID=UPI001475EA70|nr:hypothetical protein [Pseudomonas sp. WS 5051]NMY56905.1 hypothetical protein [Pseudomonas sp. WS 5051]
MAQAPKLTPDQWEEVRDAWEQDPRDGYTWLVKELGLSVSAPGVRKTAAKQGWEKRKASGKKPSGVEFVGAPRAKSKAKRGGGPKLASETIETMGETISETMAGGSKSKAKASAGGGCGEFDREVERAGNGSVAPESEANAHAREGETIEGVIDDTVGDYYFTDTGLHGLFPSDEPGKYRPKYAELAYKLAQLGISHKRIAEILEISESTFYEWQGRHAGFKTALKAGMALADANVANSVYRAAIGYSHHHEEIKVIGEEVVRVPTMKHYPPNPHLATFWLKNRQPELWKEKVEIVEMPSIALVDKEAMEAIYRNALDHAAAVQASMVDRGARLGLTIDNELDDD